MLDPALIPALENHLRTLEDQLRSARGFEAEELRERIELQAGLIEQLKNPDAEPEHLASMEAFLKVLGDAAKARPGDLLPLAHQAILLFDKLDPYPEKHADMGPGAKFRGLAGQLAFRSGDEEGARGALRIADAFFGTTS